MAGSFVTTGSYSNLTRLELEQLRKADFYAGGKALTVGDAGNVIGGTGVGSINAEPYRTGPLLTTKDIDWVEPPVDPAINLPYRVEDSIWFNGQYEDCVFWSGIARLGTGRYNATVTATNQITVPGIIGTASAGDIVYVASDGIAANLYAVGTIVSNIADVVTLTNIYAPGGAPTNQLTVSGTTHSVCVVRPSPVQLFAVPGSGPLGQEQTFMFCTQLSPIHNQLAPNDQDIDNERVRNIVPPSFNGTGNDRADAIFDSPRSAANAVGYRPVFYRGLANGSGPDMSAPIVTLNPVIDSTIPAADQRMTIDYKAGIVRFSCAPRAGDDIKPSGGNGGVNPTTGRLNLYAVWFAFPTSNTYHHNREGEQSVKQLYVSRSTATQGIAAARVYYSGGSWVFYPRIASTSIDTSVGSFAGALSASGGGGLLSSNTDVQLALDRIDDQLVARRAFTVVCTDGTNSTGGDINQPDISAFFSTYGGGRALLRRGSYQLSAEPSAGVNFSIVGESSSFASYVTIASTLVSDYDFPANTKTSFENVWFTTTGAALNWNWSGGVSTLRSCYFSAGTLQLTSGTPLKLDWSDITVTTDNDGSTNAYGVQFGNNDCSGVIRNCVFKSVPSGAGAVSKDLVRINVMLMAANQAPLVFENCLFSAESGFDAAFGGTVLYINASDQKIIFRGCRFRAGAVGMTAPITLFKGVNADNVTFEDCVFEQASGYGSGKLLDINNSCSNIVFERCTFITSDTTANAGEIVMLSGDYHRPHVMRDCQIQIKRGDVTPSALPRLAFGCDATGTSSGVGATHLDNVTVFLFYTHTTGINRNFFKYYGGNAYAGAAISRLNFLLGQRQTSGAADGEALIYINGDIEINDMQVNDLNAPSANAGLAYGIRLFGAKWRGGSIYANSINSPVAWKATLALSSGAQVIDVDLHAGSQPNPGRFIHITGADCVVKNCEASLQYLYAAENDVGYFVFTDSSCHNTRIIDNRFELTTGAGGTIEGMTASTPIVDINGSSSCQVTGNQIFFYEPGAIQLINADASSSRCIITNNQLVASHSSNVVGISAAGVSCMVTGNILENVGASTISVSAAGANTVSTNNIVL